jgi:hypothetical protein
MIQIKAASFVGLFMSGALATRHSHPIAKRDNLATVAQPKPSDVTAAILAWADDVNAVNTFLDGAVANLGNLATLASDAQNARNNFAIDEPNQLGTLTNWFSNDPNNPDSRDTSGPDAFNCATNDLAVGQTIGNTVFNFESLVKDVFDNIVADALAGNADAVKGQLDVVNSFRCCNVLPDLDIIWKDTAESAQISIQTALTGGVPITAARPAACNGLDCSTTAGASTCATKDNGRFS